MRVKVLAVIIAIILAAALFNVAAVADSENSIVIETMSVSNTGELEISGYIIGAEAGSPIACLVAREGVLGANGVEEAIDTNNIAWIDQVETDNNGVFLIQGIVREEFTGETLYVALGNEHLDGVYYSQVKIPELEMTVGSVLSNSVLYGRDVYYVPGELYTPDNIADSMAYGGNRIYFKIGGLWYDLLDENAVDNSFLTEENAIPEEDVEAVVPRYYYGISERFEFE